MLTRLAVWFIATWLLAGLFMPAFPPGGVTPPFFGVLLLIPVAIFYTARFYSRWSVPICYGAVTGVFFGYIIFAETPGAIQRILCFAAGAIGICLFSFALYIRSRAHDQSTGNA